MTIFPHLPMPDIMTDFNQQYFDIYLAVLLISISSVHFLQAPTSLIHYSANDMT